MSYLRKIEYTIMPEESFKILRNCSGCGCKTTFHNTNCFRVNANGNKIDVWLIYQCAKCKHTYNLTIYERCRPDSISKEEYMGFLSNSVDLASAYGTNSQFFATNRAEVDWSNTKYRMQIEKGKLDDIDRKLHKGDLLVVNNRHAWKIRTDKVVSELLHLSRSEVKRLEQSGVILVSEDKQGHMITVEIVESFIE